MDFIAGFYIFVSSLFLSIVPSKEFREGIVAQPSNFFPVRAESVHDKTISKLLFRGLFKYNIYGEIENDLVESYDISQDSLTYTFKLKDNQYWIDGRKITSEDVLYTSYNSPSLGGISTDRIDELTVRFKLQNKYSPFLSLMTQGIIQNNSLEHQDPLFPVSSGDFRVIRLRRSGPLVDEVTLYSQKFKIPKLVYRFYSNDSDLLTATKLGEIDAFMSPSIFDIDNFTNYKFAVVSNSYGLFFNTSNSKAPDQTLRLKISKVLDTEDIISNYGIPVEGVISRNNDFTNKKITFDKYDSKYKEDLQKRLITIKTTNSINKDIVTRIKNNLEDRLNLNVQIEYFETAEFIEKVIKTKEFEIILFGIETQRDPDRYVNWHSSGIASGYNLTSFRNPTSDKSLEDGRNTTDLTQRKNFYNKFQESFDQNLPAIFLYHPFENYYISNRVSGIGEKFTFDLSDRYLDFNNWVVN